MLYYPDKIDKLNNKAEKIFWEKIIHVFSDFSGVTFSRFPIFGPWGNRKGEPDVLLILRHYGAFILETKGCHIRNISAISGQVWKMNDWYVDEMMPWQQVERQKTAVEKLLTDLDFKWPVHGRVVLPFINSEEWKESQLLPNVQKDAVWTWDQLKPEAILANLENIRRHLSPPKLSDEQWRTLKDIFVRQNQTLQVEQTLKQPIFLTYDGDVPTNEELDNTLIRTGLPSDWKEAGYTYLVATRKLELLRTKFFKPSHQVNRGNRSNTLRFFKESNGKEEVVHLLFHNALRHLVPNHILSRSEERALLRRAIGGASAHDHHLLQQLSHDVMEWRDAIAELISEGINLDEKPSDNLKSRFTVPSLASLAWSLKDNFDHQRSQETNKISFEQAVRSHLDNDFRVTPYVIMEGFSFLTPLQRHFIQRSQEMGGQIVFVFANRTEQEDAFEVMRHTYARYGEIGLPHETNFNNDFGTKELSFLKENLFTKDNFVYTGEIDNSVTLSCYPHRHDEIRACIKTIKEYLNSEKKPKHILIVTQSPDAYGPLLLEEADLQGLPPNTFNLPPKQLLLTPFGRFILELYNVWKNRELCINAEQFESFLASGLIGRTQITTDKFRTVRDQWFAQCESENSWLNCLSSLRKIKRDSTEFSRLPFLGVEDKDIATWTDALGLIKQLCSRLFGDEKLSISEHVKKLLSEIQSSFDVEEILDTERELLERIQNSLLELTEFDSLRVTANEFGEVLNGLVQERNQVEEEFQKNKINIVRPQGVDGSTQQIVFYLGVDNLRVPLPYTESWPLHHERQIPHHRQERYLFLAVIRATQERLHLSFAKVDDQHVCEPSLYLKMVSKCLNREIAKELFPVSYESQDHDVPEEQKIRKVKRKLYGFTELFHYSICPFRYKLERLDDRAQYYKSNWQLRYRAQGIWLNVILEKWKGEEKTFAKGFEKVEVEKYLGLILTETREIVEGIFPGFNRIDWFNVEQGTRFSITSLVAFNLDNRESVKCILGETNILPLPSGDRHIEVDFSTSYMIQTKKGKYPLISPMIYEEWLLPRKKSTNIGTSKFTVRDGLKLFQNDHLAFRKWSSILKDYGMYKSLDTHTRDWMLNTIDKIEEKTFPKNPGDRCRYCPARGTCLGISENSSYSSPAKL